jgi:hypothetical protein
MTRTQDQRAATDMPIPLTWAYLTHDTRHQNCGPAGRSRTLGASRTPFVCHTNRAQPGHRHYSRHTRPVQPSCGLTDGPVCAPGTYSEAKLMVLGGRASLRVVDSG